METFERKIGTNRGAKRLWIEGKALTGWIAKHDRFDIVPFDCGFHLVKNPNGARKVSGKSDKPIIDIVGKSLGIVAGFERVSIFADKNEITIVEAQS